MIDFTEGRIRHNASKKVTARPFRDGPWRAAVGKQACCGRRRRKAKYQCLCSIGAAVGLTTLASTFFVLPSSKVSVSGTVSPSFIGALRSISMT